MTPMLSRSSCVAALVVASAVLLGCDDDDSGGGGSSDAAADARQDTQNNSDGAVDAGVDAPDIASDAAADNASDNCVGAAPLCCADGQQVAANCAERLNGPNGLPTYDWECPLGSEPVLGDECDGGDAGSGDDAGACEAITGGDELSNDCNFRQYGALITFQIVEESLTVWVRDDAFIDEALRLMAADEQRIPSMTLLDGMDCDGQWTWHVDPDTLEFADFTIELCDGLPSHIEDDQEYWLCTVTQYCPWSAVVTAVDDHR